MSSEKLSYTWSELETMPLNQLWGLFLYQVPEARNLLIVSTNRTQTDTVSATGNNISYP